MSSSWCTIVFDTMWTNYNVMRRTLLEIFTIKNDIELYRLQPSGHSKVSWAAGAAWLPTTDGCIIHSAECRICAENTMRNETQRVSVCIYKDQYIYCTMRTNLLNLCNLVSISKNVVFYAFLVVRIY